MGNDAYTPPRAAVESPDGDDRERRPIMVVMGVRLMWLSVTCMLLCLALVLPRVLIKLSSTHAVAKQIEAIAVTTSAVALMIAMTAFVSMRKQWARITLLVVFVIGLLSSASAISRLLSIDSQLLSFNIYRVAMAATWCSQALALVMLFVPSANRWFKNAA